ncbi:hypothetical protein ACOMHN_034460 [Nucella lapillus]
MTTIQSEQISTAYQQVRNDNESINWLVCKYQDDSIVLDRTGEAYDDLTDLLGDDERAFAFARVIAGDELSKRAKFVYIVWTGVNVPVLQRAKLSVDRSLMKNVFENFAVELTANIQGDVGLEKVKAALAKAGGADYGTGERD